ncbi:hypothetical protein DM806_02340 [Sphingobium lactosutens]|nr:hypothetical protein [Sphingobium lactosutens]
MGGKAWTGRLTDEVGLHPQDRNEVEELGRTLRALRRQEGGWIGAEVRNADGSVDLGPMQVNSWWVPRIARLIHRSESQVRSWLRNDPCFNVDAARWIFLSALHEAKDFWRAVGIYHSPTRWRQMRYAKGIALIMASDRRSLSLPLARGNPQTGGRR